MYFNWGRVVKIELATLRCQNLGYVLSCQFGRSKNGRRRFRLVSIILRKTVTFFYNKKESQLSMEMACLGDLKTQEMALAGVKI